MYKEIQKIILAERSSKNILYQVETTLQLWSGCLGAREQMVKRLHEGLEINKHELLYIGERESKMEKKNERKKHGSDVTEK